MAFTHTFTATEYLITATFINMRTRQSNVGGSSQLPTTTERRVIKSSSTVQTTEQFVGAFGFVSFACKRKNLEGDIIRPAYWSQRVENVVSFVVACPNLTVGRKLGNGSAASH